MLRIPRSSRRRNLRLSLDSFDRLEVRALLSGTVAHLDHGIKAAAAIELSKRSHFVPIVPNLSATPSSKITTVPANGDVNPYGIAVVPKGFKGSLSPGEILVSNFNDKANVQGTGTTIVTVTPGATTSTAPVFYTSKSAGLTLALGVLKSGYVIVGNVPTTDGTFGTIGAGSLQILNGSGQLVNTLTNTSLLDGPWASAVNDHGSTAQVFVSNVLSGTITRINFKVVKHHGTQTLDEVSMTQIASGYTVAPNSAAVVVGPGGLAYDSKNDTLYVAATGNNEVFAIPHASHTRIDNGTGKVVYSDPTHLFGPIGIALAPNGDLLVTNDDAVNTSTELASQSSALTEFTPNGVFVGQLSLDPADGAAFGFVVETSGHTVTIASVNDDTNTVDFRSTTF
jgi:sugar lactone lactonase YvrE